MRAIFLHLRAFSHTAFITEVGIGSPDVGYFSRGSVDKTVGVWPKCDCSAVTGHRRGSSTLWNVTTLFSPVLCMFFAHFTCSCADLPLIVRSARVGWRNHHGWCYFGLSEGPEEHDQDCRPDRPSHSGLQNSKNHRPYCL